MLFSLPSKTTMLLGVHCSAAGGLQNAFQEAKEKGIDTFQVFTKNQRQWKDKTFSSEDGNSFKQLLQANSINYAFSHASYLINLASCEDALYEQSIQALAAE